jgi:hypothetical protein
VVTGGPEIAQADRARWQRQAAGELTRILGEHPELPAIAWTAGPAGCVAGRVNGLAPAGQVLDVFDAWRAALGLAGHREHQLGGGVIWLHAAARRDLVRVRLTATVFAGVQEGK